MTPTLRLYNTLTRSKDVFVPIDPKNVRLYVCGPTVYDYAHIGNARPVIVFDLLFRLLRHVYGADAVTYARNFTDVDDKINARAYERGISIRELTEETARQYEADVRALGVLMPEDVNKPGQPPRLVTPRATDHIDEMRTIIERLVERGAAYVAEDHVLFSVAGMGRLNGVPKYGAFSKRSLDDLLAGARVDVAPYKRDSMDFVLWKPSGPQDPHWPSPAGIATPGRPGWHIECSAMAWRHLVKAFETRLSADDPASRQIFDIHGGGIDLVFPHHENEIAQTCCAFDVPRMANVWMHNGFLQVEGEKMSKSLGNFVTISELLRGWRGQPWSGAAIRWAMLQTHYRQPIDWTFDNLLAARNELWRIFLFARRFDWEANDRGEHFLEIVAKEKHPSDHVLAALADDLNTPEAIARIRESAPKSEDRDAVFQIIRDLMFLGVVSEPTRYLFSTTSTGSNVPAQLTSELAGLALDLRVARANQDVELAVEIHSRAKRLGAKLDERGPWSIDVAFVGTASGQPSIDDLIAARAEARAAKNWAESDRIRDELARLGVLLKDNKDGTTTWEVAR